jgi:alkane 1-monooxygenase
MKALGYWIVFTIPLWTVAGARLGGVFTFAPVVLAFVITPLLDALVGEDARNPSAAGEERRARNPLFELALWTFVPVQLALLAWGIGELSSGSRPPLEALGILAGMGISAGGGGITVAHELMHRRGWTPRAAAEILMLSVSYPHFCVEHVLGHHKRVGTSDDPATARLGEGFWVFLPRVLWGSLASAWALERARCARRGIRAGSLADRRVRYVLELAGGYGAVWLAGGWAGVAVLAGHGVIAVGMLEVINYIEHYGLVRRAGGNGALEKVGPRHSWSSDHRVTRYYLFDLPRHADHHQAATRPYWKLRHLDQGPRLPAGYAAMLLCAVVPPLWHRIMDPRARAWAAAPEPGQGT